MSLTIESKSPRLREQAGFKLRRKQLLWLVYLVGAIAIAVLLTDGYSYYSTPYQERPHHPDYRELRPAGPRGLLYGITGSAMMLLMLVYSLRKRTRLFGLRIPLRPFLDFHVFMGVFGPLFILLHTSFKVQGLVAIAFWSMVAVALSGYLGRYLYQQIPRNAEDRELGLREIEQLLNETGRDLDARGNFSTEAMEEIHRAFDRAYGVQSNRGFPRGIIAADLIRPFVRNQLRRTVRRLTRLNGGECDALVALASRRALLRRRLASLERVQHLFHYWHVIHKPFAIIMYIIMFVHIGVAVWTGYGWFRG